MPSHARSPKRERDDLKFYPGEYDSYFDSDEFRDYAAAVEYIVHHSETPVGTRQIHSILGDKARREWTLDALDSLRSVKLIEGLVNRWKPATGHAPVHSKRWSGDSMGYLFGRGKNNFADLGVVS